MDWQSPRPDEKLGMIREINRIEALTKFTPEDCRLEYLDLPFYPDGRLVSIIKPRPGYTPLFYVQLPEEIVAMNRTVANIHYCNERAPLALDAGNIAQYLRFYYYFSDRGWLESVITVETPIGFQATAQIGTASGLFETILGISPRGEVNVESFEQIGPAKPMPKNFIF